MPPAWSDVEVHVYAIQLLLPFCLIVLQPCSGNCCCGRTCLNELLQLWYVCCVVLWQLKADAGALSALPSLLDCISQSLSLNNIDLGLLCKTCARLKSPLRLATISVGVWPCACSKHRLTTLKARAYIGTASPQAHIITMVNEPSICVPRQVHRWN